MVDERVTDGRRIAQLLASEVRGHERGALEPLVVTDVEDVPAGADGERAYRLVLDGGEGSAGDPVATVLVHPDRAVLVVERRPDVAKTAAGRAGLEMPSADTTDGGSVADRALVTVESGAAVKDGVDVLRAVLAERGDDPR